MSQRRARGFTLVELLVVITIIGMLVALLIPAIMSARRVARNTQCQNNIREVGSAVQQFDFSKQHYPGMRNNPGGVGWPVMVLQYLSKKDLYDNYVSYHATNPKLPPSFPPGMSVQIAVFLCPADTGAANPLINPTSMPNPGPSGISYVGNSGVPDDESLLQLAQPQAPDYTCSGIFMDRTVAVVAEVSASNVAKKDGVSTTILLSENVDAARWDDALPGNPQSNSVLQAFEANQNIVWWYSGSPPLDPNKQPIGLNKLAGKRDVDTGNAINYARPSSMHGGTFNVTFCDNHVIAMSEDIDYTVFCRLMTPSGADAAKIGGNSPKAPWQANSVDESMIRQ